MARAFVAFVDFIGKEGCRGWPREGQTRMRLSDISVYLSISIVLEVSLLIKFTYCTHAIIVLYYR